MNDVLHFYYNYFFLANLYTNLHFIELSVMGLQGSNSYFSDRHEM